MQQTIVMGTALLMLSLTAHARAVSGVDGVVLSGPPESARAAYDFAYEACIDKEEGMDCSLTFDNEELSGSCVLALDQRLFCLPDDKPAHR